MRMTLFKALGCALLVLSAVSASAQPNTTDRLWKAIRVSDAVAVRSALAAGASAGTRDSDGFAPLVLAVLTGGDKAKTARVVDVVQALLDAGADINQEGPAGTSPLAAACSQTANLELVRFLLGRGANVNQRGYGATTPLYQAVRKNQAAIAELLVAKGANVKAANDEGATALHYAALNGMEDTADMLLARGAVVNARDAHGKTPLSWARGELPADFLGRAQAMPAMVELLRRHGAE